jgi:hypothetical protein
VDVVRTRTRRHLASVSNARATLGAAFAFALAASSACNAITDTGKYELVDCPNGVCDDGAASTADGPSAIDAGPSDAASGSDTSVKPLPVCGQNEGAIRLTVSGGSGSITSNPPGLSVSSGMSADQCFALDTLVLETNGPTATWGGVTCKDGSPNKRCELTVPSGGKTLTAALP